MLPSGVLKIILKNMCFSVIRKYSPVVLSNFKGAMEALAEGGEDEAGKESTPPPPHLSAAPLMRK